MIKDARSDMLSVPRISVCVIKVPLFVFTGTSAWSERCLRNTRAPGVATVCIIVSASAVSLLVYSPPAT